MYSDLFPEYISLDLGYRTEDCVRHGSAHYRRMPLVTKLPSRWNLDAFYVIGVEQVADLVAQLAERDYPTKWEGFLEQMMQVRSGAHPSVNGLAYLEALLARLPRVGG